MEVGVLVSKYVLQYMSLFYGHESEGHQPFTGGELKDGLKMNDDIDMNLYQVKNVGVANDPGDVITKQVLEQMYLNFFPSTRTPLILSVIDMR